MLHIVFARPREFHRNAGGFRDLDRFVHMLAGASETAAQKIGVDLDLLGRKAGDLFGGIAPALGICVPAQISQLSGFTATTQLCGSIGACER